nr:MAG TPA: hypothetical protein [Caudoviricetes sp.]
MQKKEKVLSDVEYYRNEIIKLVKNVNDKQILKLTYYFVKGEYLEEKAGM